LAETDFQVGFANETTHGTPAPVTRFYEFDSESIEETYGRTEGDPLRTGTGYRRNDRHTPYFAGAAGSLSLPVMTKGFGYFLPHMLGAVATTGPTDSRYVHTGTEASIFGDFFTCQVNRPFHPAGTNQAFTYGGGKITEWTLSNAVDGNLMLELSLDFASVSTAVALATASYPTAMDNFAWAGGVVQIGGSAYDLTEFSLQNSVGSATDRRQIRGNTQKKEQTTGRREASFSVKADFESMTQRTRAAATVKATNYAQIIATWTGPTLIGATAYPEYVVTIPAARFDAWKAAVDGPTGLEQELSGVVGWNGSASPITIEVKSADVTA
jgi:hypothetical protein